MLDKCVDFLIENIELEHQNMYLNDKIRFCVMRNSYSPRCYLVKGFDFTQKRFI